ncbi:MAG: hypothetical protein AAF677_11415 [Pseudomonadota bacterium]
MRMSLTRSLTAVSSVLGTAALALTVGLAAAPPAAATDSVIEARLKALKPCAPLKKQVSVGSGLLKIETTIGIDRMRALRVKAIDVSLRGDAVSLTLNGGLTCGTAGDAVLKGDAGVEVSLAADVDLATCTITKFDLEPVTYTGSFRDVVQALWPSILGPKIETNARTQIVNACNDFKAGS